MFSVVLIACIAYSANSQTFSLSGKTTEDSGHNQVVTLEIDTKNDLVQITFTGKSSEWMGTGFGSHEMDHTYVIVADGVDNVVGEWKLTSKTRGSKLRRSITVTSNSVKNGVRYANNYPVLFNIIYSHTDTYRTVVVTRNVTGSNSEYYTFPTKQENIEIIWAYGPSSQP
eukprot:949688_1